MDHKANVEFIIQSCPTCSHFFFLGQTTWNIMMDVKPRPQMWTAEPHREGLDIWTFSRRCPIPRWLTPKPGSVKAASQMRATGQMNNWGSRASKVERAGGGFYSIVKRNHSVICLGFPPKKPKNQTKKTTNSEVRVWSLIGRTAFVKFENSGGRGNRCDVLLDCLVLPGLSNFCPSNLYKVLDP